MTKRIKVSRSTDSASGSAGSHAATETRKLMCSAMDEPPEGSFVREMVRCKYAVEPGQKLCAKHIFVQRAVGMKECAHCGHEERFHSGELPHECVAPNAFDSDFNCGCIRFVAGKAIR